MGGSEFARRPGVGSVPNSQVSDEETREIIGKTTGVYPPIISFIIGTLEK